ncbi:hypothetical protein BH09PLA1_BH09PLA1_11900 [soil metagenome]
MRTRGSRKSCPAQNRFPLIAAAALSAMLGNAVAPAADTLIQSFETGGFDAPGDPDNTVTPFQAVGVTEGSFSLRVDSTNTSFWTNPGLINATPSAVLSNSVLKWDVTTSTGVQFVPIFLTNGPGGGGYFQAPSGFFVGASAAPQTIAYDYSGLGLPADATSIQVRLQLSDGSPVSFYLDNVRVSPASVVLQQATASWKVNGSADWVNANSWNATPVGAIPGAAGSNVTFDTAGGTITTPSQIVVNLTQPVQVANMTFNKGGGGYKLAGGFAVALSANLNVVSGSHVIASPLNVSAGVIFDVAASSSIQVDNLGCGGFGLLEKLGGGTLTTDKVQNVSINIDGGSWNLKPGNAQANGFIYGVTVGNGGVFRMNGAAVRTNGLYTGGAGGTIDLGMGGVLTTGLYGGNEFFGAIVGNGSVQIGGEGPADVMTFSGPNSYTGSTTITTGDTLVVTPLGTLGSGDVINNANLEVDGYTSVSNLTGTGTTNVGDGTSTTNVFTVKSVRTAAGSIVNVNAGATLVVTPNGTNAGTSRIGGSLTIAGGATRTATLDLNDNDLIATSNSYAQISNAIRSARTGGTWTGMGLTSTTARNALPKITGLGAITGAQFHAAAGAGALFDGVAVANSDVLVKYTYNGDTDLNGVVNFDDYSRTDSGFNTGGTDWFHGDFDYNGIVNFDDYSLIDSAFNQQGGSLRRMLSFLDGSDRNRSDMTTPGLMIVLRHFDQFGEPYAASVLNSVPEPSGIALVGAALGGVLRRRRSRQAALA